MQWINNRDILVNLRAYFPRSSFAARIANIVDKLIGNQVKWNEQRSKHVMNVVDFHFDDPEGRIVKVERNVEEILVKLDRTEKRLIRIEKRFSRFEKKLSRMPIRK